MQVTDPRSASRSPSVPPAPPVVVMGVSAVGKTTVGIALARLLRAEFVDADDLHPAANIAKMATGIPLTDDDRLPWLALVGRALRPGSVTACSALKRSYRDLLRAEAPTALFVHLEADPAWIAARAAERPAHFMPPSLLRSQLDALEPLGPDEAGTTVVVDAKPAALATRAAAALELL